MTRFGLSSLALILLAACGGDDTPPPEPYLPDPTGLTWAAAVDNPYFPLPVGATWAYEAMIETVLERVGSSRVDLQACKLEYSIVSPK